MKNKVVRHFFSILIVTFANHLFAQNVFNDYQRTSVKNTNVYYRTEDSLQKQFESKKLTWPPQSLYIRSFKYDRQLEVWVKSEMSEPYKLFKTYKVCMQSGTVGP